MMDATQLGALVHKEMGDEIASRVLQDGNTDWQKEILRTSFSQDYNLSVSGTAGFLPYRVSASYTDNQGILKESGMQRTTVGFSLSPKFFNGLLSINANANGTYATNLQADQAAVP